MTRTKKYFNKNKELTTNQELYSQKEHTSDTPVSTEVHYQQQYTIGQDTERTRTSKDNQTSMCCCIYSGDIQRHIRYWDTKHSRVNLEAPSTNIFWFTKDLKPVRGAWHGQRALRPQPTLERYRCLPAFTPSAQLSTSLSDIFESLSHWTSAIASCSVRIPVFSRYEITIWSSCWGYLDMYFRWRVQKIIIHTYKGCQQSASLTKTQQNLYQDTYGYG